MNHFGTDFLAMRFTIITRRPCSCPRCTSRDRRQSPFVVCPLLPPTPNCNLRKENCPNVSLVYSNVPIMPCKTHKGATCNERS